MNFYLRTLALSSFAIVSLFSASTCLGDLIVMADDFDGGQTTLGGVTAALSGVATTESVQNYAGIGTGANVFGGNFLRNRTGGVPSTGTAGAFTTLTLTNLPTHQSIDIGFLLGTIDSWDGVDGASGATGDYFNVRVDGLEVFEATFAQLSGSAANAYQAQPGGELSTGSNLFGLAFSNDGAYDMGFESALSNITHTSSTLVIDFYADGPGWQGEQSLNIGEDESWAIDNLQVSINAVPEPSSVGLLALAVGGFILRHRRR